MHVTAFNGDYEAIAGLLGTTPDELRGRDQNNGPPDRWVATDGARAVGVATTALRPDNRLLVRFATADPSTIAPLAAAVRREAGQPLYTSVDSADSETVASLNEAGFRTALDSARFRIRFDAILPVLQRAWTPADYRIISAADADRDQLLALDNALRDLVPGLDGWAADRQWMDDELADSPPFDPEAYLIAVHEDTGRYAGLMRVWRNKSGPRIGLLGVLHGDRTPSLAAALLKQALTAASTWGFDEFTTETSPSNRHTYAAMLRHGFAPVEIHHEMVLD